MGFDACAKADFELVLLKSKLGNPRASKHFFNLMHICMINPRSTANLV
jgi:hypothetical protein